MTATQTLSRNIRDHEQEIRRSWAATFRARLQRAQPHREEVRSVGAESTDLLALLQAQLGAGDRAATTRLVAPLVERVRQPDYSIGDLFCEIDTLKEAIGNVLAGDGDRGVGEVGWILRTFHALDQIFDACLAKTSVVYEAVLEGSVRGYCQVDRKGRILYANPSMNRLVRTDDCRGRLLRDFFGKEGSFVEREVSGREGKKPLLRRMFLRLADDVTVPVSAEFGPLVHDGKQTGGYAVIVDISSFQETEYGCFESSELGFMKLDVDLNVIFANHKASDIFGLDKLELSRRSLWELFPDDASHRVIKRQGKLRREGRGGEYTLDYQRPRGGKAVPVLINGMPEFDNRDQLAGFLTVFRSLELEYTSGKIHALTERNSRYRILLDALFEELKSVISFEFANVSIYSRDMKFARAIHFYPRPRPMWETRWFPISTGLKEWIKGKETWGADLGEFIQTQPGAEEIAYDPVILRLIDEGYKSFLCLPIREPRRVAAVLTLFTKEKNSFGRPDLQLITQDLPVENAVRVALYGREREEQSFFYKLLQIISSQAKAKDVAKSLVEELTAFYGWQNVAIVKVNRVRDRFELIAQAKATEEGYLLPFNYRQPIGQGIFAEVCRTGKYINLGDVDSDDARAKGYVQSNPHTKSELCLPVRMFNRIEWLLNLEDSRLNAFAPPEIRNLKRAIEEIESTLDRLFHGITFEEIFAASTDGVVITDAEGSIVRCNPAAERLFQLPSNSASGRNIETFIADPDDGARIARQNRITSLKVEIRGFDEKTTAVLVNGGVLPDEYDLKVLFLQDLGAAKWQHELSAIGGALSEIAAETRVPLSLAASYVRRLGRSAGESVRDGILAKVTEQLDKVELTYDRVIAVSNPEVLPESTQQSLDLGQIVEYVKNELPAEEARDIDVTCEPDLPDIRCNAYEIVFVVQSIFAYFLRTKFPDERIDVDVAQDQDMVVVRIAGPSPDPDHPPASTHDFLSMAEEQARANISLGEPVMKTIIELKHKGIYHMARTEDGQTIFKLKLRADQ